jgi:DNA replication initiation complex subunit (GINS family)
MSEAWSSELAQSSELKQSTHTHAGEAESAVKPSHRRGTHRRVIRQGTEHFDADGVKEEAGDRTTKSAQEADDDRRILGELPPHWGVFSAEKE